MTGAAEPLTTDQFPNTRWSLVLTAQQADGPQAQKALSDLFEVYWYPVYGYVRRRGHDTHDAEDLTQAFFESLIRRESLSRAHEDKGKLRAFLLASVKNFLIDQHRKENADKRGGSQFIAISADAAEMRLQEELATDDAPDVLFERAWAHTLLHDVMKRLEASYARADKLPLFEALSSHLLQDTIPEYRDLSKGLGTTVVALRIQYHRMKQRYGELLDEEIRHTVSTAEEAEEERHFLLRVLAA